MGGIVVRRRINERVSMCWIENISNAIFVEIFVPEAL